MIRKIVNIHNKSLREHSRKVGKLDKKILALIEDMKTTLKAQNDPEGVGLAAPQIGENLKIFVANYRGRELVVVNPTILSKEGIVKPKTKKGKQILEGCLSLPHYYGPIERAEKVKVRYQTPKAVNGSWKLETTTEEFAGFIAHIIQHEIDHLEGRLFIDRILEQKAPLYRFQGDDWEEVDL